MSLVKDKASLFSSQPSDGGKTPPAGAPAAPVSKTAGMTMNSGLGKGMSVEAKRKKVEEARESSEKGMNALKTSFFQWKPDHLAAASYFEKASDLYKQAGELKSALLLIVQAADSHEASGALGSAALARIKGADLAREVGDLDQSRKLLFDAAENWGIHGDLLKYGETLGKLAKEEEDHDSKRAKTLYLQALERICPSDTPTEQLGKTHVSVLEVARSALSFLIRKKEYQDAIKLAKRMALLYSAFEIEGSMCKALLSITVLQLTLGDSVQAQQTYLQEHLNNAAYLRSKESELADLLVLAFTNRDLDQLDKAKMHSHVAYLDREIQTLLRDLDIFAEWSGGPSDKVETAPAPPQKQKLFASSAPAASSNKPAAVPPPAPISDEHDVDNQEDEVPNIDDLAIPNDDDEVVDTPAVEVKEKDEDLTNARDDPAANTQPADHASEDEIDLS